MWAWLILQHPYVHILYAAAATGDLHEFTNQRSEGEQTESTDVVAGLDCPRHLTFHLSTI